jgi:hypothetical protein
MADVPSIEDLLRAIDQKAQAISVYFAARQEAPNSLTTIDMTRGFRHFELELQDISRTALLLRQVLPGQILNLEIDRRGLPPNDPTTH